MAADASSQIARNKVDPLRRVRIPGWRPVEFALAAMLLCSFALIPWLWAAYSPATSGDTGVALGMSKEEVLVVLGEPNERQAEGLCWNYDRFHEGNDRVCVRFDEGGRVTAISRNAKP